MRRPWMLCGTLGLTIAALLLTGCAAEPDLAASRDALRDVATDAAPLLEDGEASKYDADAHPDPVVEPLECAPVLVITARGTGEPPKHQLLGPVARGIAKTYPDDVERLDLDYPADTEVNLGGTQGARTLVDTLNVQAEACPDQRFVLLGYSQGALIIGDVLSAADVRLVGTAVGTVSDEASERIDAIVLYGNPRFVGSEPGGGGNFDPSVNGILPRPPGSLAAYEGRLRDYCVPEDYICQSTFDLEDEGHLEYFDNGMQERGVLFATSKLPESDDAAEEKIRDKAEQKAHDAAEQKSDNARARS